jgi:hypothetical protein
VIEIKTTGKKKRNPIVIDRDTVTIDDPDTTTTVSNDNLAVVVTAPQAQISLGTNNINVSVNNGQENVSVNAENPRQEITVNQDNNVVVTDATEATNNVAPVVPVALQPDVQPASLPPTAERDLSNASYVEQVIAATTTTTSTTVKKNPQIAAGTTIAEATSTTTTTRPPTVVGGTPAPTSTPSTAPTSTPSTAPTSTPSTAPPTTATPTTSVALNCVFVINRFGVQGFSCNDGTRRGWRGYLTRFAGDTYYFNYDANTGYQYGDYTANYNVESVPAGFTANGRYTGGNGCHPNGCP